jgi:hypothetical protein
MIFVYSDDITKFNLSDYNSCDLFIVDCNLNNYFIFKNKFKKLSFKKANKNFNYIPYIKISSDIKYNSFYSCYYFMKTKPPDGFTLIFDIKKRTVDHLDCINSFVKRRYIKNLLVDFECFKKITFNKKQCEYILCLVNFLTKTKVISIEKNFFDFVFNYYHYLNQKKSFVES